MDVQKSTTLEEVYDHVRKYALSDSLFVIGVVNASMRYNFHELQKEDIPEGTIRWINDLCKDNISRFDLSFQLTRLARFLLLSRSNDYKSAILDTGTPQLQQAIYLTSTLHDKEVDVDIKDLKDVNRVFGRIGQIQFPLQSSRTHIIGRGYLLFALIPNEIKTPYDFNEKAKEYFGISILEYLTTGLALWITSTGILKHNMKVEVQDMQQFVTQNSINKFVELSSGTPEDYKRLVRGDDWQTPNKLLDIYGLDPFVQIPAIKINYSPKLEIGSYIVPQPFYLLQKSSMGLFYLLSEKERIKSLELKQPGRNDFRENFGPIYRGYVGKLLSLATPPYLCIDLDETSFKAYGKKPDFAIVFADICILFEIKTSILGLNSRTFFDENTAKKEIQQGAFEKALTQLNDFERVISEKKMNDHRFEKVKNIVKIMVGFEDIFLANSFLLPLLRDVYGEKVNNLQIATITDVELIGTLLSNNEHLNQFMLEKIESQETAEWPIASFLYSKCKKKSENPLLKKSYESFMEKITGKSYLEIIGNKV